MVGALRRRPGPSAGWDHASPTRPAGHPFHVKPRVRPPHPHRHPRLLTPIGLAHVPRNPRGTPDRTAPLDCVPATRAPASGVAIPMPLDHPGEVYPAPHLAGTRRRDHAPPGRTEASRPDHTETEPQYRSRGNRGSSVPPPRGATAPRHRRTGFAEPSPCHGIGGPLGGLAGRGFHVERMSGWGWRTEPERPDRTDTEPPGTAAVRTAGPPSRHPAGPPHHATGEPTSRNHPCVMESEDRSTARPSTARL